MILLAEAEDNFQFGCDPCRLGHVFSKPQSQAGARYRAQLEQRAKLDEYRKHLSSKPKYFLPTNGRIH
jgi:hypothetical protein